MGKNPFDVLQHPIIVTSEQEIPAISPQARKTSEARFYKELKPVIDLDITNKLSL